MDACALAPAAKTLRRNWRCGRGQLVGAALTLCQAWVAAGRPAGNQTFGMFKDWAAVMGGILYVAGVAGLLANAQVLRTLKINPQGGLPVAGANLWSVTVRPLQATYEVVGQAVTILRYDEKP